MSILCKILHSIDCHKQDGTAPGPRPLFSKQQPRAPSPALTTAAVGTELFCDTALLPVIPPSQTVKSGAEIHAVSLNPTAAIGQGLIWFFAGGLGGYSP